MGGVFGHGGRPCAVGDALERHHPALGDEKRARSQIDGFAHTGHHRKAVLAARGVARHDLGRLAQRDHAADLVRGREGAAGRVQADCSPQRALGAAPPRIRAHRGALVAIIAQSVPVEDEVAPVARARGHVAAGRDRRGTGAAHSSHERRKRIFLKSQPSSMRCPTSIAARSQPRQQWQQVSKWGRHNLGSIWKSFHEATRSVTQLPQHTQRCRFVRGNGQGTTIQGHRSDLSRINCLG